MPQQVPRHAPESGPKADTRAQRAHHSASAETLWEHLREHRCDGFRFRRQVRVFGGIAEFYCAAAKLVVQVVGASRRGHKRSDARNNEALAGAGLRVLYVPASLVGRDPRTAAKLVADALMESGHAPGPARASNKYHFGPGPVGDAW
jgi:very-short-patch-repair endonuclease